VLLYFSEFMGQYNAVVDAHTAPGAHDLSFNDIDAQDLVRSLRIIYTILIFLRQTAWFICHEVYTLHIAYYIRVSIWGCSIINYR